MVTLEDANVPSWPRVSLALDGAAAQAEKQSGPVKQSYELVHNLHL